MDVSNTPADAAPEDVPRAWNEGRRSLAILSLLIVAALVPRAWQAWHWDILWPDTVTYGALGDAVRHGDFRTAFGDFGLNVYPFLVAVFRECGESWNRVGEAWSVAMGTLAVLPLYGWMRRQFDERIALVGCVLYAVQPQFVAFSPLVIRDATFWFLFATCLYCFWRAAAEAGIGWYLASGAALTLAAHTRSEGWFLLVPLVGWSAWRAAAPSSPRVRIIAGTLTAVAIIPASIVLVNFTLLKDCPRWEVVRPSHAAVILRDLGWAPAATAAVSPSALDNVPLEPHHPPLEAARKLGSRLVKTFSYGYGLMAIVGIVLWRRRYLTVEHQVLAWMSLMLLGGLWVFYMKTEIDIRYMLPIVIAALPWMAVGVLGAGELLAQLPRRLPATPASARARWSCAAGVFAFVFFVGLFDTELQTEPLIRQQVAAGQWIRANLGAGRHILGSLHDGRIVAHYAQGYEISILPYKQKSLATLFPLIRQTNPEVLVLYRETWRHADWAPYEELLDAAAAWGYTPVAPKDLADCHDLRLLIRTDELARVQRSKAPLSAAAPVVQR